MSDRRPHLVSVAAAIEDLGLAQWEKSWDDNRDREVAEQRARQQAEAEGAAVAEHRDAMLAAGSKLREIEEAARADEEKPAIVAVKNWDVARHNIIVLSGAAGVGKTVAAAYWALHRKRVPR